MTLPKKSSALFELIRKDDQAREKLKVPHWWRSRHEGEEPSGPVSGRLGRLIRVLFRPVGWRMPIGLWALAGVLIVTLPVATYYAGEGYSLDDPAPLRTVQSHAVNPDLTRDLPDTSRENVPGTSADSAGSSRQRQPGMNYFCLETMPNRFRSEAERAAAFLQGNSVDALVVDVQNGQIQLIALRGFAKPHSDPQAKRFASLLRSLGRTWKAEHKGWSDWKDLYAIKYNPANR